MYVYTLYIFVASSCAPKSDDRPCGSSSWKKGKIAKLDRKETDLEYQYPRTG